MEQGGGEMPEQAVTLVGDASCGSSTDKSCE